VILLCCSDGLGEGQKIPGVTNPYVYVGSWKTMFGWHKEDLDLYSINYLHNGNPKFWYSIDLSDNEVFEEFMEKNYPEHHSRCSEFIRHKTTIVNPTVLLENQIKMVKCLHNENEFMVSRAAAYHSGFNFGFNIAEAVNFALPDWLDVGNNVNYCRCIKDSVAINMRAFYRKIGMNPEDYLEKDQFPDPKPSKIKKEKDVQPQVVAKLPPIFFFEKISIESRKSSFGETSDPFFTQSSQGILPPLLPHSQPLPQCTTKSSS
jgi:DNA damage-responsive transcriptional repressor / [histone H3]-trimethyl-L-lysine36 demethylase